MKLSYEWLKEYVKINATPEKVAQGLTMSGSEVEELTTVNGDTVMNLEITSNRPDCLSIIGLAREVSTVFNTDMILSEERVDEKTSDDKGPSVECVIKNKKLCRLYTAKVITGVTIREINEQIKKRLLAVGIRTVNNIVDITNYCLMETGQPMHAFDLDKISGNKIFIREAAEGEKIITIDDVERTLTKGMLVIADKEKPIAIAGIMGGKRTEVTKKTTNILLESAYFDPLSIRRTSRELALISDSSYRFERGVDKGIIEKASARAAALILKEAGGQAGGFYKDGEIKTKKNLVKFSIEKASRILGVTLGGEDVKQIFCRLGMEVKEETEDVLAVEVPSFREDITREIDLVEEAARIYGYENIPSEITRFVPQARRKERSREVEEKLKETLSSIGLNEIMTYSLISETSSKRFGMISKGEINIVNPLSEEQKVLTPQLVDGMLKTVSWNLNRNNKDLKLFELGKIYSNEKNSFNEIPVLCIAITGKARDNWKEGERPANLFDLKGVIETAFDQLHLSLEFNETELEGMVTCARIGLKTGENNIGFLVEAGVRILEEYDISQEVFIGQIRLDSIMEQAVLWNKYDTIVKFPSSERDISILCDRSLPAGEIYDMIYETGGKMVQSVEFKDIYEGKQIPSGKKSLTYGIKYGLNDRTITDEETEKTHTKIKDILTRELKISFR